MAWLELNNCTDIINKYVFSSLKLNHIKPIDMFWWLNKYGMSDQKINPLNNQVNGEDISSTLNNLSFAVALSSNLNIDVYSDLDLEKIIPILNEIPNNSCLTNNTFKKSNAGDALYKSLSILSKYSCTRQSDTWFNN
ncbi:hypothetical protein [Companilactobacillus zhachilii]|uniref:hypothetical protein n=1 Tax=Companilactobacillus zhachilii TaxID=2304606 RepID=UPI0040339CC7